MKHALFAFCKPVPEDADAREELLVRSLYRAMQEEHFTDAYRMMEVKSIQGDGECRTVTSLCFPVKVSSTSIQ